MLYAPVSYQQVYSWWEVWRENKVLPYEGGTANQPAWVWLDFGVFSMIEAHVNSKRGSAEDKQ